MLGRIALQDNRGKLAMEVPVRPPTCLLNVWNRHDFRPCVCISDGAGNAEAARPHAQRADTRLSRGGGALQVGNQGANS